MGNGWSVSKSISEQSANANLSNQYAGTCNISCNNTIDNATLTLINSQVGGDVGITQSCSVNGQCMFNTSQNATADVMFKATNSSNAKNAATVLPATNRDKAKTAAYQTINEMISNSVSQACNISSANSMDDVSIFAVNSEIGGNLVIGQVGNVTGGCALQSMMSATALASGTANDCSSSGKKTPKKSCGGKGGTSIGKYLLYGVIGIVIFIVIMIVYRMIRGSATPATPPVVGTSKVTLLPPQTGTVRSAPPPMAARPSVNPPLQLGSPPPLPLSSFSSLEL